MTLITGTVLDDILVGTPTYDTILGLAGDDNLSGDPTIVSGAAYVTGRPDLIRGGLGADTIYGDGVAGVDLYYGSAFLIGGADHVAGGLGNDYLFGDGTAAASNAELTGGADVLCGGAGNDRLYGEGIMNAIGLDDTPKISGAADRLYGGSGSDWVWGDGSIWVYASALLAGGDDRLYGGADNDDMWGDGSVRAGYEYSARLDGGDDTLFGGRGDDSLRGDGNADGGGWVNGGDDRLMGGAATTRFMATATPPGEMDRRWSAATTGSSEAGVMTFSPVMAIPTRGAPPDGPT